MNVVELRGFTPWRVPLGGGVPFFALAILFFSGASVGAPAEPAATKEETAAEGEDDAAENDGVVSMAAYNAKADRIEDFGLRVHSALYHEERRPNLVTFWFADFAPMISSVLPNTAASKAGLQPGERILKSEGQSTVGGPFSTAKLGKWYKIQKKKWAEVAAGKKNVTWTLEIESPKTNMVRTVKLVVPTPPPHWGSAIWQPPEGRSPSVVAEPGPLAECSRAVLDNGVWLLVHSSAGAVLEQNTTLLSQSLATGYEWRIGNRQQGLHRIFVTQFRGRTDVILETYSPSSGTRIYLTAPSGALEKAWLRNRKGTGEVPLEEARIGFENELDFWTTKVGKVSGRWPFEVKPGYDANAIFAVLAAKDGVSPSDAPRPFAQEFLKLPAATEAQQAMFSDAYGKLGAEQDRWAYTETSRGIEDKRVTVTRVDPSKVEGERCVLLSLNGKSPTPAEVQQWRDEGGDLPKALGNIPPLTSIVDLKDLRVFKEETAAVVFELPIRNGNADFPTEKFQALFRVNKTYRSFEDIVVKMRESFRVAGVVKITEAGLQARFQTLDPAHPPQPVLLKGGGAARILLVKIARDFETTRAEFKRVEPYVAPDVVDPIAAPIAIPIPAAAGSL
jgi:hypothetical protein